MIARESRAAFSWRELVSLLGEGPYPVGSSCQCDIASDCFEVRAGVWQWQGHAVLCVTCVVESSRRCLV